MMAEYSYRIFFPSFYDGDLLMKYQGRVITLTAPLRIGEIVELYDDGEFSVRSIVRELSDSLIESIYPIVNLIS